ncbi:uncharacterized protein LOC133883472 [Phragmites australis]|uniref:uncharacterized protein LOC133883472 n=1 Tax=Phragmites australis TaxID=29695 RepID=UPI002D76CACE|nr:uncharacterized protein LOC133883472 [Phragmites australis]
MGIMTKGIETSTHDMPSASPKPASRTGFSNKEFYDNFTPSINNELTIDRVDLDEDLIGDDSSNEQKLVKDESDKAKGKKTQIMTQRRDSSTSSNDDDSDSMSYPPEEIIADHMFGGSVSYKSKKQDNFQIEKIMFDVVDFKMAYNAILGGPALAKFMVAAHYAYQYMKISRLEGVITVQGCPKIGLRCDKCSLDMATQHQPDKEAKSSKIKVN